MEEMDENSQFEGARKRKARKTAIRQLDFDRELLSSVDESDLCSDEECQSSHYTEMHGSNVGSNGQEIRGVKSPQMVQVYKDMLANRNEEYEYLAYNTAVFEEKKLGVCVIVNFQEKERRGSIQDARDLKSLFENLNFEVKSGNNESSISVTQSHLLTQTEVLVNAVREMHSVAQEKPDDQYKEMYEAANKINKERETLKPDQAKIDEWKKETEAYESKFPQQVNYYNQLSSKVRRGYKTIENTLMLDALEGVIQESKDDPTKYQDHKMFVLIIMAHGSEGLVKESGTDRVMLDAVYKKLSHTHFPAMKGKPKWVIIQACKGKDRNYFDAIPPPKQSRRSNLLPKYVQVDDVDTERSGSDSEYSDSEDDDSLSAGETQAVIGSLHSQQIEGKTCQTDDLFIWFSCFPNYVAKRHRTHGACFIRAIIDVIRKHARHMHLQEMFERVQAKVRTYTMRKDMKHKAATGKIMGGQQPTGICTLTKNKRVYLFPKIDEALEREAGQPDEN